MEAREICSRRPNKRYDRRVCRQASPKRILCPTRQSYHIAYCLSIEFTKYPGQKKCLGGGEGGHSVASVILIVKRLDKIEAVKYNKGGIGPDGKKAPEGPTDFEKRCKTTGKRKGKIAMKEIQRWVAAMLIPALLSGGCAAKTILQEDTVPEPYESTNWTFTGDWTAEKGPGGGEILTAPGTEGASALYGGGVLEEGWSVEVELTGDGSRVLLCESDGSEALAVSVEISGQNVRLIAEQCRRGEWSEVCEGADWVPFDESQPVRLSVYRYAGQEYFFAALWQNDQQLQERKITGVTERTLSRLRTVGLGADGSSFFSGFSVGTAEKPDNPMETLLKTIQPEQEGFYRAIAEQAVADVVTNFWMGDTRTGRIRPTWSGFSADLPDDRGGPWEAAMLLFEIYDMWAITQDPYYLDLVKAEARFFRENYTEEELENAGGWLNWACDDCAWNALMYLSFYSVTGDEWFVDRTIALLDRVNERWYDPELNGLLYKDGVDFMALYEVGIAWSWLQLWEITGEERFFDLALRSYEGMHDRLGADRDDGIYYCEANRSWPRGGKTNIHEAGSASFLAGNMGMAALSAKFYRLTGEQTYLDRVYRINEGIALYYDNDGVLLNDRDAWTNGTFAAFYASEVLTLPDTEQMQELLKNTAVSIVTNARTEDGHYGGSWSGPAEGSGSLWYANGSVPEQSMTTGSSVLMVTAAAILEAGTEGYVR